MHYGLFYFTSHYSVLDFCCGQISLTKGEFIEESFLAEVEGAMLRLGLNQQKLAPYNPHIVENVETMILIEC